MRKIIVAGSLLALAITLAWVYQNRKPAPLEPAAQNVQPEQKKEAQPPGPLSFWTGEVVIGEGPNRGKIELLAVAGKEAVVLTADDQGLCSFDPIDGMKKGEMSIRLQKRGQPPLMSLIHYEKGQEVEMHPVCQLSQMVKDGKITPLIAPHIVSPVERKYWQRGQRLEGYTWSIRSWDEQVYGRGRGTPNPRSGYVSTAIEITPPVKADLKPFEVDLKKRHFTDAELAKMAAEDRKFDKWDKDHKNGLREFKTSEGVFRVVSCSGRQSIDPNAKNSGGMNCQMLQLPSGKWMNNTLNLLDTAELDGQLYLFGRHHIFKWINNEKLECVVSFEGVGTKWSPYIDLHKERFIPGYLAVNKSSDSDFGGLLEYSFGPKGKSVPGKWVFHQYDGDYGSWVETMGFKEDCLILNLFNGWDHQKDLPQKKIRFNPKKGTFTDL